MKKYRLLKPFLEYREGFIFWVVNGMALFGQLPWGWEIPEVIIVKHPEWFKEVIIVEDTNSDKFEDVEQQRLADIAKYFGQIKEGHDWCRKNADKESEWMINVLLPAIDVIYDKLLVLGVEKELSSALFITGGTTDLKQFKK